MHITENLVMNTEPAFPEQQYPNYLIWRTKLPSIDSPLEQVIQLAVKFGRLAPSTHNTQPWHFTITSTGLILRPNLDRRLPFSDPQNRGLITSLGCFAANFMLACAQAGWSVTYETNFCYANDLSRSTVTLRTNKEGTPIIDHELALMMTNRFSSKFPYLNDPISADVVTNLESDHIDGTSLVLITKSTIITALSKQYVEGASEFARKRGFREEISKWLRPNDTREGNGMPGFVAGIPLLVSKVTPLVLPSLAFLAMKQVGQDAEKLAGSPLCAMVVTNGDEPIDWFFAGIRYEVLQLRATLLGLHSTPLGAMIETRVAREELMRLTTKNKYPQMFARLGHSSSPIRHTPRQTN